MNVDLTPVSAPAPLAPAELQHEPDWTAEEEEAFARLPALDPEKEGSP